MLIDQYQSIFTNVNFCLLFFGMTSYWISLIFSNNLFFTIGKIMSIATNIVLFLFLADRWIENGYFPLSNLYESLLFLSWILLSVHLILEYKASSKLFGSLLMPVILAITTFATFTLPLEMQKASPLVPALQSNWLMMHVSLMMVSYGTLIAGSLLSILFLLLVKNPKSEKEEFSNNKISLPSSDLNPSIIQLQYKNQNAREQLLTNLDNWSYRIISLGFPFLTIGIIAGAVWANEAWGSYWSWDPKETWALITWLVFAAYLHARLNKGWQGKKPAILGSIGFFVVWICYLGVNFLGQGLHTYGWLS